MNKLHVCLHGHFYQPPRENPFTGVVEDQPSASPFDNWNERITAESYAPNLAAAVLDDAGNELRKVNNYSWISFDFGPTLLSWLESHAPETYAGIIDADRQSTQHFDGHGSALAQGYNHTILPLSTGADKRTQVRWGIADFVHRFGRSPQGMWLPETAVDNETLEILADEGIKFTILSPYQVDAAENELGSMVDVSDGSIDPRLPYFVEPTPGKRIAVMIYNGPLSRDIAFNGLLDDGRLLARRLLETLDAGQTTTQLAHVATDGETYGHHHRFGEMALAAAIEALRHTPGVEVTNYAAFLAKHPPQRRLRISHDSSWSCAHGVERWRNDCGCSTGGEPGWNQKWRGPLRAAFDWLRDTVNIDFEASQGRVFRDPWQARNAYIEVVLGRSEDDFLAEYGLAELDAQGSAEALGLLDIQRASMLMYTSCGWFFNDLAGLETVFVLRHAGRVVELVRKYSGRDLEPELLDRLESAVSNRGGITGRAIYQSEVAPFMTA